MNKNMITNKDLLYIKDMMTWNLITNKKINHFLDYIEDDEIKNMLKKIMKMHKLHYENLLELLK